MENSLTKMYKDYRLFFYLYAFFLFASTAFLVLFSKEETFFFINELHSPVADLFFKLLTHLGDGILFSLIIVVLAFYRYRFALLGLVIFLGSSFIAQLLKRTLFDNMLRPVGHFGKEVDIHFVEGVTRHVSNSFPSGHTTTAFALAVFLMLIFKVKKWSWLMALVAILVGYSRVYLAVHFPMDVYAGSIIGVLSADVIYLWLNESFKRKFGDKGLINKT